MHTNAVNAVAAVSLLIADTVAESGSAAAGVSQREWAALVLVATHPVYSLTWLFPRLGLTQSGAVRLVDRLVDQELLDRAPRPGGREVALTVTADGQDRLDRGAVARSAAVDAIIEHLTPDQQTTLAELADAMLRGGSRERRDADIACRWCDWSSCDPDCPVDASVTDDETVIDEPGRAGSPRARGSGR